MLELDLETRRGRDNDDLGAIFEMFSEADRAKLDDDAVAEIRARSTPVISLRHEIKSLNAKLKKVLAEAQPPSEREEKLRETIKKLRAQLRDVSKSP